MVLGKTYIHTYIIGHYNPSARITNQLLTPLMLCVNFIREWRDLQFKVDSERQIFCETFHDNFNLLSEFLPELYRSNIFIEFRCDVVPGV